MCEMTLLHWHCLSMCVLCSLIGCCAVMAAAKVSAWFGLNLSSPIIFLYLFLIWSSNHFLNKLIYLWIFHFISMVSMTTLIAKTQTKARPSLQFTHTHTQTLHAKYLAIAQYFTIQFYSIPFHSALLFFFFFFFLHYITFGKIRRTLHTKCICGVLSITLRDEIQINIFRIFMLLSVMLVAIFSFKKRKKKNR